MKAEEIYVANQRKEHNVEKCFSGL